MPLIEDSECVFTVVVDYRTARRLRQIQNETGRTKESLGSSAIEEAALDYFRGRNDDPG